MKIQLSVSGISPLLGIAVLDWLLGGILSGSNAGVLLVALVLADRLGNRS